MFDLTPDPVTVTQIKIHRDSLLKNVDNPGGVTVWAVDQMYCAFLHVDG